MTSLFASTSAVASPDYSTSPSPVYLLRAHTSQISVLKFSSDGRSLYSGDVEGFVIVWNLISFRPRLVWKAHQAGILTIEEWADGLITHGRDNLIHHYTLPNELRSISRSSATSIPSVSQPSLMQSDWQLNVNSMAYCRMSLLRLDGSGRDSKGKIKGSEQKRQEALIAVPSLIKDEQVDVFHLPSCKRVHRSIGEGAFLGSEKTGTVMALCLFRHPSTSELYLLIAYESGLLTLFHHSPSSPSSNPSLSPPEMLTDENEGWHLIWGEKKHREAIMGLAVGYEGERLTCWTVGADHFLVKCRVFHRDEHWKGVKTNDYGKSTEQSNTRDEKDSVTVIETESAGKSDVGIREDGRILGVAGWDGEVRLYAARSGKALATLSYHRTSLHALAFGPLCQPRQQLPFQTRDGETSDSEDELIEDGERRAWLAVGGQDERISLWNLYP